MRTIQGWQDHSELRVAESKSGVLVTTHYADSLVRHGTSPWPTPELLQKMSASSHFKGATPEDQYAATAALGYYCDLQSLNSEDAITWSVFGLIAYLPPVERQSVVARILEHFDLPGPTTPPAVWLWRRLPHPEKPQSSGGPEIDFGFLTDDTLVLGEAKWNSPLGTGQGVNGDKTQQDIRAAYCDIIGAKILSIKKFVLLGVGRTPVFKPEDKLCSPSLRVVNASWSKIIECHDGDIREELRKYLSWKCKYSGAATPAGLSLETF